MSRTGTKILKELSEGKYATEEYDYHLQLNSNVLVLLTKHKLFYLKKSIISGTWDSDWIESWSNCYKVIREPNAAKLRIILNVSVKAPNRMCGQQMASNEGTRQLTMGHLFNRFQLD